MLQRPALTTQVLEKLPWFVLAGGEVLRMSLSTEVCWLSHLMLPPLRNTRAADVSLHNLISVNLEAFDCTDASEAIGTNSRPTAVAGLSCRVCVCTGVCVCLSGGDGQRLQPR